ncbi:hypothetical protein Z949_3042 [Sulfitobacter guttiformis KCTC 32187]|nr:hypothetical protein Z949_3042 [Sulfitobacter guttiformis KCTC 32187]
MADYLKLKGHTLRNDETPEVSFSGDIVERSLALAEIIALMKA